MVGLGGWEGESGPERRCGVVCGVVLVVGRAHWVEGCVGRGGGGSGGGVKGGQVGGGRGGGGGERGGGGGGGGGVVQRN